MEEDWTDMERKLIERLRSNRFRPSDPEAIKLRVMTSITAKNGVDVYWWMKAAAGLLILLMVATYVVEEGYTHYYRFAMNTELQRNPTLSFREDEQCGNIINYYLSINTRYDFVDQDRDTLFISLADVACLRENYPQIAKRIDVFINAIKILYPFDYARLESGEIILLNVKMLKRDRRLCAFLVNNY